MSKIERSPFAHTFDRPLVRKPEWDAVIRRRRQADRAWNRLTFHLTTECARACAGAPVDRDSPNQPTFH